MRGGDAEFGEQAGDGFGQGSGVALGGCCLGGRCLGGNRLGGVAEAGQVDRDDVEVLGERGDDRVQELRFSPIPCNSTSGAPEPERV